jgi:hypothetical protein
MAARIPAIRGGISQFLCADYVVPAGLGDFCLFYHKHVTPTAFVLGIYLKGTTNPGGVT